MNVTGKGNYNVLCDVCGFKKKASEVKRRWDGAIVCQEDWELRHPLDFFTTRNDVHKLPFTRPDNDGIDIGPPLNPLTSPSGTPPPGLGLFLLMEDGSYLLLEFGDKILLEDVTVSEYLLLLENGSGLLLENGDNLILE